VNILKITSPWVFPVTYRIALSPSILPPPPSMRTVFLALLLSAILTLTRTAAQFKARDHKEVETCKQMVRTNSAASCKVYGQRYIRIDEL
jgi:hypothetical protein